MNSAERRVTVSASVYPILAAYSERDGVTVADVANAILLQTLCPYGVANRTEVQQGAPTHQPDLDDQLKEW